MDTRSLKTKQMFITSLIALGMVLTFSSCVKYNPTSLRKIKPEHHDDEVIQQNVSIRTKNLSRHECKKLFDGRERPLFAARKSQRIYPIQLIIENNSGKSWVISPQQINLELVPYQQIYHKMRTSTGWRIAGGVIGGLFGLNALGATAATAARNGSPGVAALAGLGQLAVLIGAPVATYKSAKSSKEANTELKDDLKKKTLYKDEVVKPGQFMRKIIFLMHKDYKPPFVITLENERNSTDMLRFVIGP